MAKKLNGFLYNTGELDLPGVKFKVIVIHAGFGDATLIEATDNKSEHVIKCNVAITITLCVTDPLRSKKLNIIIIIIIICFYCAEIINDYNAQI